MTPAGNAPCSVAERLQQQKEYLLTAGKVLLLGSILLTLTVALAIATAFAVYQLLSLWIDFFTGLFVLPKEPDSIGPALAFYSLIPIGLVIWILSPSIRLVWRLATQRIAKAFKG